MKLSRCNRHSISQRPKNVRDHMPRPETQLEAMTPGQLAKRWGVSVARVRSLVESGRVPGAFRIPSVGRYGEAIKIPLASVLQQEQDWSITPIDPSCQRGRPRRHNGARPKLKHFPELNAQPEPDAECPEDAQP